MDGSHTQEGNGAEDIDPCQQVINGDNGDHSLDIPSFCSTLSSRHICKMMPAIYTHTRARAPLSLFRQLIIVFRAESHENHLAFFPLSALVNCDMWTFHFSCISSQTNV